MEGRPGQRGEKLTEPFEVPIYRVFLINKL
jgi:hypothetical protein